jgi:hypothetical protein
MIKHMRRTVACAFAFVVLALASGCNPGTTARVVGPDGAPVAGAEVYANNLRIGQTDASGVLAFPRGLALGTALVARNQIFERPGYRSNHGPENGGLSWTERVYLTSMEVNNEGVLVPLVVTAPAAQQTLVLRTDNTLIGLHFMVSVIWDASTVELDQIRDKFSQAGDYIYNATDGQIYFEQVDIVDDNTFWNDAEFHCNADLAIRAYATTVGGLLVPNLFGSVVELSTLRTDGLGDFQVIDHELGHLGFGLLDEYVPAGAFCSARRDQPGTDRGTNPDFWANGPKASCVMDDEWEAGKFCSNRAENPHTFGSLEAANCWEAIANTFSDHTNPTAQWTIKTPDTRGAIVGRLPPGSSARWQPRINIDNRASPGSNSLCQPFAIRATWNDGTSGVNWPVTLAVGSRQIREGPTDSNGSVTIVGAHPGDRIWIGTWGPWRNVVATPSVGPNTCGAP